MAAPVPEDNSHALPGACDLPHPGPDNACDDPVVRIQRQQRRGCEDQVADRQAGEVAATKCWNSSTIAIMATVGATKATYFLADGTIPRDLRTSAKDQRLVAAFTAA